MLKNRKTIGDPQIQTKVLGARVFFFVKGLGFGFEGLGFWVPDPDQSPWGFSLLLRFTVWV